MNHSSFEIRRLQEMSRSLMEDYERASSLHELAQLVKAKSYDKPAIRLSQLDDCAIDDIAEALQRCSERKFNNLGDALVKIKAINTLMQDT